MQFHQDHLVFQWTVLISNIHLTDLIFHKKIQVQILHFFLLYMDEKRIRFSLNKTQANRG